MEGLVLPAAAQQQRIQWRWIITLGLQERIKMGEERLLEPGCKHIATAADQRNLIMVECVLFCCLHPRVKLDNIKKARRVAWLLQIG